MTGGSLFIISELGMKKTGFNSDLMLLSLNLYARLNCASKMIQLLVDLDIKSVQYDSMGYICFPHLARLDPGMFYNNVSYILL